MAKKSSARILLVNDDVYQLSLIANFLEKEDWDVTSTSQTEKAIEKIRKEAPFDLVITDLHMPVIDGWRFCRLLRSQEFSEYNDTPLLVISATFSGLENMTVEDIMNAVDVPEDWIRKLAEKTVKREIEREMKNRTLDSRH